MKFKIKLTVKQVTVDAEDEAEAIMQAWSMVYGDASKFVSATVRRVKS